MNAPPSPITPRDHDERGRGADEGGDRRSGAEHEQADHQRAAAAELVAHRARGEQQAGEHQRVGVDDPLQLAGARVQLLDQRGQRDVEDRVVDAHDEQAEAEDGEDPPAALVRLL